MKKALIAMSGGVDSSVAAHIMIERGYEVIGCTMKLFQTENEKKISSAAAGEEDAEDIARKLGIPFHVFDCSDLFETKVIRPFAECYIGGITPNPCIHCNRYLKFGMLLDKAEEHNCDILVTGHYARVLRNGPDFELKKALYPEKDQSYVLYSLSQRQLGKTAFPLGELSKREVRSIAEQLGFLNAHKPESQDICFIPDGDYAGYIEKKTGTRCQKGNFISPEGKILGTHRGIIHYTVGQRRGLGISAKAPLYVLSIDPLSNTITLAEESELKIKTVIANDINIISGRPIEQPFKATVKLRYRQPEKPALVWQESNQLVIHFEEPLRAPAPGQAAVIYCGDTVIGGGTIVGSEK